MLTKKGGGMKRSHYLIGAIALMSCLLIVTIGMSQEENGENTIRNYEMMTGRKAGNAPVPGHLRALENVTILDGFRFFSGYYRNLNNHPAIYAASGKGGYILTVIGAGQEKKFSMEEADEAFKFYLKFLKEQGY